MDLNLLMTGMIAWLPTTLTVLIGIRMSNARLNILSESLDRLEATLNRSIDDSKSNLDVR